MQKRLKHQLSKQKKLIMHNHAKGIIIPNSKAIFASSCVELEKGEVMYKSTAIVEPNIIESDSIILETKTGKTLEICFELDPDAWIKDNLSKLKKYYREKVVELLRALSIVFVIGLLIYLDLVIAAIIIALLAIIGIGLYVQEVMEARRDMIEFQNQMESGQLEPNMDKSIAFYYTELLEIVDARYLWGLNQKMVLDYEICSDEYNTNFLKVVSANKENGDIETREFRRIKAIRNINAKHAEVQVLPYGIYLRIPYEIIP